MLNGTFFTKEGYYVWPRRGGELPGGPVGPVRLDPTTDPVRFELISEPQDPKSGKPRRVMPGIAKFEGDNLVLAWGWWVDDRPLAEGQDYPWRPKDFKSTKENGITVETLKPCLNYDQD